MEDGEKVNYHAVEYEEDIYYGYRYYETRYATMLQTDYDNQVKGREVTYTSDPDAVAAAEAWYDEQVVYPYGYGLSYTTFKYTDAKFEYDAAKDVYNVSVTVTNMVDLGQKGTVYDVCSYASSCVVAATWNDRLAYEEGIAIGNECLIGNEAGDGKAYSGWYAPAVNIHRSPFSGRNSEYYSEDGLLSGNMAANVVQGAKQFGVYTMVKHFAVNDQETHRSTNGISV